MKKVIFVAIGLICLSAICQPAHAQLQGIAQYEISNPYPVSYGSYSGTPTGGTQIPGFPWYTKLDTVVNAGVDTFKQKIVGVCKNVVFTAHIYSMSGTLTANTVSVWASGDTGKGVDFAPISTYTLTANGTQLFTVPINNGSGNIYTNYWMIFRGSGTQSCSWKGSLLCRYKEDYSMAEWLNRSICRYGAQSNELHVE